MKKLILHIGALAGLVFMNSCSSLKVYSDFDPTVDWTKYKTFEYYGWAEESDKILNDLDKRRFESAFGDEFKARGLEYVENDGDMVVTLFIVVEEKKGATATTTHMGGGYGGYYGGYYGYGPGYGWGGGHSTTNIQEYSYGVGTLVCDVFDAKNEKLIWEGIASKTVDENPQTRDTNIPKAVKALMAKFPIPAAE